MVLIPAAATIGQKAFLIDPYEAAINGTAAISVSGKEPAVGIDFAGAKAACEVAGKRLCTHKEWLDACRGPSGLKYGVIDEAEITSFDEEPGDSGNGEESVTLKSLCYVSQFPNNGPGTKATLTGIKKKCKTQGYEVFDMIGNVSEWVVGEGDVPIASGVSFYQLQIDSHCDATLVRAGEKTLTPTEKSNDIGFRCCAEPSGRKTPSFPF